MTTEITVVPTGGSSNISLEDLAALVVSLQSEFISLTSNSTSPPFKLTGVNVSLSTDNTTLEVTVSGIKKTGNNSESIYLLLTGAGLANLQSSSQVFEDGSFSLSLNLPDQVSLSGYSASIISETNPFNTITVPIVSAMMNNYAFTYGYSYLNHQINGFDISVQFAANQSILEADYLDIYLDSVTTPIQTISCPDGVQGNTFFDASLLITTSGPHTLYAKFRNAGVLFNTISFTLSV